MKHCVDLHTHTLASDGRDTPAAVVSKAAWLGLSAIAITDHDTLDGLAEAEARGKEDNIEVIRGCELSVLSECGEVHILGLWIPQQAQALEQALKQLRHNRMQRNVIIVERLQKMGIKITYEEVLRMAKKAKGQQGGKILETLQCATKAVLAPFKGKTAAAENTKDSEKNSIGRPHIAAVLLEKGYVTSIKEAFIKYLADGCPAYEPKKIFEVEEVFRLLQEAQATISLAHPGLIRCTAQWLDNYIGFLKNLGLCALEVHHSEHDEETTARMLALTQKYDLGISGGSDYHGSVKPTIHLGCGKGNLRIGIGVLEALKEQRRAMGYPV